MISVAIADRQKLLKLDRPLLRRIVRTVLLGEGIKDAEIGLAFVDNAAIARLNWQFLHHEGPTDVLTFPLAEETPHLNGEIVISTEFARAAAKRLHHRARDEVSLYVIHGLLHLCSYDDRQAKDRRRMRERERHYLGKLKIRLAHP